jgi:delta 1-pyrroline-5-carboxylate dehydrogenase
MTSSLWPKEWPVARINEGLGPALAIATGAGCPDAACNAIAQLLGVTDQALAYQCDWLLEEASTSINTAAAGGNASLMTIG